MDPNNPYVEINEVKKNKTFIAKQSDTYDEEKNVAEKAPVDEIKMDDLSKNTQTTSNKKAKKYEFVLVIADFYYLESAHRLKNELSSQISMNNFFVNKLTDNSYRLAIGPFKNFNALKSTYISLNNLGFGNLNIQRILK